MKKKLMLMIFYWQKYRANNPECTEVYEQFKQFNKDWEQNEIHQMTDIEIDKLISDLGYTIEQLEKNADNYLENKLRKSKHPKFGRRLTTDDF